MMYPSAWLALRADAAARARSVALLDRLQAALAEKGAAPLIVDLGAGTGALFRAIRDRVPPGARWRLIDKEAALLEEALAAHPASAAEAVAADLGGDLAPLLAGADCVAATAFFDLCSAQWIERFAAALPEGAVVYAALTYNGEEVWSPPHDADAAALEAFHAHQRQDFGLGGPALGPHAAGALVAALERAGFEVSVRRTPWILETPRDAALMDALAAGTAEAASTFGADGAAWRAAPRDRAVIGHYDLFATR